MAKTRNRTREYARRTAARHAKHGIRPAGRPKGAKCLNKAPTAKQRAFVLFLFDGKNMGQAFRLSHGVTAVAPGDHSDGSRMLKQPHVRKYYDELCAAERCEAVMSRMEKRRRLAELARSKISDVLDADGRLDPKKVAASPSVRKIRVEDGVIVAVELPDALAAIREDNAMSGDNAPVKISAAITLQDLVGEACHGLLPAHLEGK